MHAMAVQWRGIFSHRPTMTRDTRRVIIRPLGRVSAYLLDLRSSLQQWIFNGNRISEIWLFSCGYAYAVEQFGLLPLVSQLLFLIIVDKGSTVGRNNEGWRNCSSYMCPCAKPFLWRIPCMTNKLLPRWDNQSNIAQWSHSWHRLIAKRYPIWLYQHSLDSIRWPLQTIV